MWSLIFSPFKYIENIGYRIVNAMWVYPDLFLRDSTQRRYVLTSYRNWLPYSHFTSAAGLFAVFFYIFFVGGMPRVFSSNSNRLVEGVVMGLTQEGNVQRLNGVNPLLPSNIQLEKDLVNLLYEPLVKYNFRDTNEGAIGGVEFVLAEDIITIKPGSDYIFKIRKGVTWHDSKGSEGSSGYRGLTADDVISTFNIISILDDTQGASGNANAYTKALKQLQWEKVDDFTVRVCTRTEDSENVTCDDRRDNPIFSNFLELISFKIIPAHLSHDITAVNANSSEPSLYRTPVGTGLFKIKNIGSHGITVTLYDKHYSVQDEYVEKQVVQGVRAYVEENMLESKFETLGNGTVLTEFSIFDKTYSAVKNSEGEYATPVKFGDDLQKLDFDLVVSNNSQYVKEISFLYFGSLDKAVGALKNGEVHSLASTSVEYLEELEEYTHIQLDKSPVQYTQFWGMYFNLRKTPDGNAIANKAILDKRVRQAISAAIDRTKLIEDAMEGVGAEAVGPIPHIAYYFNKDAGWFRKGSADPNKLLADAGWVYSSGEKIRKNAEGEKLSISLYYADSHDRRSLAESLKKSLEEYGVELIIDRQDHPLNQSSSATGWGLSDLNDQVLAPRLFDIILYGMNTFIDPDRYELYHSSQSNHPGLNLSGYASEEQTVEQNTDRQEGESSVIRVPKVDRFLELAKSFDPDKNRADRKDRYFVVQDILADEVPVAYLFHPQFLYYTNRTVQQISFKNVLSLETRFSSVGEWKL